MENRARRLALGLYLPLVMCLLVAGLYSSSLRNPFLEDDRSIITANPDVVEPGGWAKLWHHHERFSQPDGPRQYRPLVIASYRLNDQITGLNPAGFRIVNMTMLALLGCVVGWWLTGYVGATSAWLAAFVFIAHPVQAQAINLINGRAQLLAMLGLCAFGWLHRRALLTRHGSVASALGAMLCAALAMGSDTTGLLVIPLAIVQAWLGPNPGKLDLPWLKRPDNTPSNPRDLRPVHAGTALLLLIPLGLYLWGRTLAIGWSLHTHLPTDDLTRNPLLGVDIPQRLASTFSLAIYYLTQLIYPRPCTNTIPAQLPTWNDTWVWVGMLLVFWLLVLLALGLRHRHWLAIAGVLALGQFLLVGHALGVAPIYAAQLLALPMALAGTMVLAQGINRLTLSDARRRAAVAIPAAMVVIALGISTWVYNSRCQSVESMRLLDLERQPGNPVAMYRFGSSLVEVGRFDEALPWLETTVDLRPESIQARTQLADLLLLLGRPASAQEQYQRILDHHPQYLDAHAQLAEFALAERDLAQAEMRLQAALDVSREHPRIWRNMARLAAARDAHDEALRHYRQALTLAPDDESLKREYEAFRQGE